MPKRGQGGEPPTRSCGQGWPKEVPGLHMVLIARVHTKSLQGGHMDTSELHQMASIPNYLTSFRFLEPCDHCFYFYYDFFSCVCVNTKLQVVCVCVVSVKSPVTRCAIGVCPPLLCLLLPPNVNFNTQKSISKVFV